MFLNSSWVYNRQKKALSFFFDFPLFSLFCPYFIQFFSKNFPSRVQISQVRQAEILNSGFRQVLLKYRNWHFLKLGASNSGKLNSKVQNSGKWYSTMWIRDFGCIPRNISLVSGDWNYQYQSRNKVIILLLTGFVNDPTNLPDIYYYSLSVISTVGKKHTRMLISNGVSLGGINDIYIIEFTAELGGCTTKVSPLNIPSANIVADLKTVELFVVRVKDTWFSY